MRPLQVLNKTKGKFMNSGTAIFEGNTVAFIDWIIFNSKAEYLIVLNSSGQVCTWVRAEQLDNIVYHVNTIANKG